MFLCKSTQEVDSNASTFTVTVTHYITWYGTSTISLTGFVVNSLILWVWHSKPKFDAMCFLFKTLAVFDLIYIITFNLSWYSESTSKVASLLRIVTMATQYMLVNTTLTIVLSRWLVLRNHSLYRQRLTRPYLKLAVGIVVIICSAAEITESIIVYVANDHAGKIVTVVMANMFLTIPTLVQTVFIVHVLWLTFCAQKVSPAELQGSQDAVSDPTSEVRSNPVESKLTKAQRLTYCIVSIAIMSFVAYPPAVIATNYCTLTSTMRPIDFSHNNILFASINELQVLNSTVNFFFYLIFLSSFRRMFYLKFITLYTGEYSAIAHNGTITEPRESLLISVGSWGSRRGSSQLHLTVSERINDDALVIIEESDENATSTNEYSPGPQSSAK